MEIVEKLEGFLYAEKGRQTLIHRNQDLLDTPKICFDTFNFQASEYCK